MDPSNFQSMKDLKLCETSSCTDLPLLQSGQVLRRHSEHWSNTTLCVPTGFPDLSRLSPNFKNGKHDVEEENGFHSEEEEEEEGLCMKSSSTPSKVLTVDMVNEGIKVMTYAVRGPLLIRANEIDRDLMNGVKKPFKSVIKANIGDAHAMGNQPITFIRQVMAIVTCPDLLHLNVFPSDVKARAEEILKSCRGGSVGAYSDSPGIEIIRRHAADYITQRDNGIPADWRNIMLSAGASEAIRSILKLMTNPGMVCRQRPGVMIPIPQYPLYSATLAEYGMEQVGYYLDESDNWSLRSSELERSIREARKHCTVRAIVVINPGNPTGQVLSRENIELIIKFAHKEKLFLLADEVYQHNVYASGTKFHSFKKVMMEMGPPYDSLELVSFMSCSKGYMGECGVRGGYAEIINMDTDVMGMLQKSISAKLCPPILGQACMDLVVNPPRPGDESYDTWRSEVQSMLAKLARKAEMVASALDAMEGMACNVVQGAMYAFPRVFIPERAVKAAEAAGQPADVFYAFCLLESTGICVIPGSGFGQQPGTYHFRTTILPKEEQLEDMLDRIKQFHIQFLKDYQD